MIKFGLNFSHGRSFLISRNMGVEVTTTRSRGLQDGDSSDEEVDAGRSQIDVGRLVSYDNPNKLGIHRGGQWYSGNVGIML